MKKLILCLMCLWLFSCEIPQEGKQMEIEKANTETDTKNYQVVKLFTVDSITVYRFYDHGYYRYFTSNGQVINNPYPEKEDEDDINTTLLYSSVQ